MSLIQLKNIDVESILQLSFDLLRNYILGPVLYLVHQAMCTLAKIK
jgi:hypothetical protein